ncbi:hypothetical protein F5B20DRAFT_201273 [Whalleya microplaca]|nr:hypothetical protein F5B20DRAFT_201273 [Whalleya microplaca]
MGKYGRDGSHGGSNEIRPGRRRLRGVIYACIRKEAGGSMLSNPRGALFRSSCVLHSSAEKKRGTRGVSCVIRTAFLGGIMACFSYIRYARRQPLSVYLSMSGARGRGSKARDIYYYYSSLTSSSDIEGDGSLLFICLSVLSGEGAHRRLLLLLHARIYV